MWSSLLCRRKARAFSVQVKKLWRLATTRWCYNQFYVYLLSHKNKEVRTFPTYYEALLKVPTQCYHKKETDSYKVAAQERFWCKTERTLLDEFCHISNE